MYIVYRHYEYRKARVVAKINAFAPEDSPKEDVVIELPNGQVKIVDRNSIVYEGEEWPDEQEEIAEGRQAGAEPELDG